MPTTANVKDSLLSGRYYRTPAEPLSTSGLFSTQVQQPAASIWFEIWGVVDPSQKILIFQENFRFFQAISQTKNRIFRANFQVISYKISIFLVKFPKNLGNFPKYFDFLGKFPKIYNFCRQFHKKSIFRGTFKKNLDFQAISQKNSIFQENFPKISILFQAI